ncbi:MAG: hypothetical protein QNJ97_27875 [Myxococcota bacterium]|nr:hypothetical protein [Myxococcota bacterium]
MHIITGLLLAGLFGKSRQGEPGDHLPRFRTGPIRVAHALPGRIRFLVPSLKRAPEEHLSALSPLEKINGIGQVRTCPISGSILVEYQKDLLDPVLIFGAVARLLGLDAELEKTPQPALTRELRSVESSLNRAVFDKTLGTLDLRSATALALLIAGGMKVFRDGWASFPAGFTLLWWGLHALPKGD